MTEQSLELRQFIAAVRMRCAQDKRYLEVTPKQLTKLNIQLNEALKDKKDWRKRVVSEIVGIPKLTSTKQLTLHMASVLIDLTNNGIANDVIRELQASLEA